MSAATKTLVATLVSASLVTASPIQDASLVRVPRDAVVARADKPSYIPEMPEKCLGTSFTTPEDRKKVWEESKAGALADAFIRNNDMKYDNWVQNLYKLMFPKNDPMDFACLSISNGCDAVPECEKFEEAGYVGGYYLFRSIAASHSWIREFRNQVLTTAIKDSLAVDQVYADFHYKPPPENPGLNVVSIMAAAFGGISGLTFANPVASASLGAFSGFLGVLANTHTKKAVPTIDGADVVGSLSKMVDSAFDEANDFIDKLLQALYSGGPQEDIPQEMMSEAWSAETVRVFGEGKWILNNAEDGLQGLGIAMAKQMKQALAWQLIRLGRNGFMVINMEVNNNECAAAPNGVWSERYKACFDLQQKVPSPNARLAQPTVDDFGNDLAKLWTDYGMDKHATYENAAQCWEKNNGAMGSPGHMTDPKNLGLSDCTFGMTVLKGRVLKTKHDKKI